MTVQDVINMAKYGELSNLSIKTDNDAILTYINLGMTELYKRFVLSPKEYILELGEWEEFYEMPQDYMFIISAYGYVPELQNDEDPGTLVELPVNEEDDVYSINTVSWNTIQVPLVLAGRLLSIMYAAKPPVLTVDNLNDPLPLPQQLVEALLHYVGYRAHMSMNGSIQAENSTHYTRFNASCNKVELDGALGPTSTATPVRRLRERGFV